MALFVLVVVALPAGVLFGNRSRLSRPVYVPGDVRLLIARFVDRLVDQFVESEGGCRERETCISRLVDVSCVPLNGRHVYVHTKRAGPGRRIFRVSFRVSADCRFRSRHVIFSRVIRRSLSAHCSDLLFPVLLRKCINKRSETKYKTNAPGVEIDISQLGREAQGVSSKKE